MSEKYISYIGNVPIIASVASYLCRKVTVVSPRTQGSPLGLRFQHKLLVSVEI